MLSYNRISVFLVLLATWTAAHSPPPPPLARISHPSSISILVLPRERAKRSVEPVFLQHSDSLRISLTAFDATFHLHLRPTENLLHPNAKISYGDGPPAALRREEIRAYMGEVIPSYRSDVRFREDAAGVVGRVSSSGLSSDQTHPTDLGWARIVVHDPATQTFEGAFSVSGVIHHITTRDKYLLHRTNLDPALGVERQNEHLVIWRESDAIPHTASTCGQESLEYPNDLQSPMFGQGKNHLVGSAYDPFDLPNVFKRQDTGGSNPDGGNFINNIGQTAGCPTIQRTLFMGVAADCEYVSRYGSQEAATTQILTNWNTVSALYRSTFNVSIGITELQVQSRECPSTANSETPWNIACSTTITLEDRLSLFSRWRGTRNDDAGLWHLMSGCPTGTEVGIAWLRTLCQRTANSQGSNSVVSGTGVSTGGTTEWRVVAHEVGHNMGAIHDCAEGCDGNSESCCPFSTSACFGTPQSIMAPSSNGASTESPVFSQCSIGNICSLMRTTDTSCLLDANESRDRETISENMCGNGIVEAGEDCDPGINSNSSCCDAATCRFQAGAVCDPENSACCTGSCGFTSANTTCRASQDGNCDTAEVCTGTSAECPADVFAPNGQECGDGLACASGQCTSISQQCQTVGASLGLTDACPQQSTNCQVSCRDPSRLNSCILLQSPLIDGSPCGIGGFCSSGSCNTSSDPGTVIRNWFQRSPSVAYPVVIIGSLLALVILWCILIRVKHCCCGRRVRKGNHATVAPFVPGRGPGHMGPPGNNPPMPMMQNAMGPAQPHPSQPTSFAPQRYSGSPGFVPSMMNGGNRTSMAPSIPASRRGSRLTRGSRP